MSESAKDFLDKCDCNGKLRYVENLDIIDPHWRQVSLRKKPTKKDILKNKINFIFSFNIKSRLHQIYHNTIGKHINYARNRSRAHRNPSGMQTGFINSILNEFNFHNVQWILVMPITIAITILLTFTNGISILLTFVLLVIVGYLSQNMLIGAKNAIIAGAASYFLGSLFAGSFLYIILYLLLGIINGSICGLVGGYIKTKKQF